MQFPRTLLEFQAQFPDEASCWAYLRKARWPRGFLCPRCGSRGSHFIASRRLEQCRVCRYQGSVTAGTVFHGTRVALQVNVVDDLNEVLRSFVEIIATTPLAVVLPIFAGEGARDPELAQTLAPLFKTRRALLISVLERAVSRRELPPDIDLEAAADVIMGPIVTRLFFMGTELSPASVGPFVDAALFGINRLRA